MEFKHLPRQYAKYKDEIDSAIMSVLSDAVFIGGQPVNELEIQLAEYVDIRNVITCANGSDSLELAIMALGISAGDAVFVPSFTYVASAACIKSVGATPIFIDVDKTTFNMLPDSLEYAIKKMRAETDLRLKAVVIVDLFGVPADYSKLSVITQKYGLKIIEDGAQSFGAKIHKKKVCSFGDIATTSFFPVKPLGCYGDGGAIFTDNDEYAMLIRSLKSHGSIPCDKYDSIRNGRNSRLDTIQAAILSIKLKALDDEIAQAQIRASEYAELLPKGIEFPVVPHEYCSAWAQYTVRFDNEALRNKVKDALLKEKIPTMLYYRKPLHSQQAFEGALFYDMTNTNELSKTVLSLPFSPYMTEEEVSIVCAAIREVL
jgi:dTDP-4-amino-4,6-dideoxygalactose transaminase